MSDTTIYTDADLRYAATSRCPCGAGLAYPLDSGIHGSWDCSDILTGRAVPSGDPGAVQHTDRLPFAFYEIKSEDQPSANGATTRPRPLTDEEVLQRSAMDAVRRCRSLDSQIVRARAELQRLESEYAAEDNKRNELVERVTLPPLSVPDAARAATHEEER